MNSILTLDLDVTKNTKVSKCALLKLHSAFLREWALNWMENAR